MLFQKTFNIEASSQEEANNIAKALSTIYTKVPNAHLLTIAVEIEKDPKVIGKVLKIANNPLVKKLW